MSSPSDKVSKTRSQDAVQANSQYAVGMPLEDTASSVRRPRVLPGGSSTIWSQAPNSVYEQWQMAARSHSVSPGQRRSPFLLGLLVAQNCTQLAEQMVESALSGVGRIEDETRHVRELVRKLGLCVTR